MGGVCQQRLSAASPGFFPTLGDVERLRQGHGHASVV